MAIGVVLLTLALASCGHAETPEGRPDAPGIAGSPGAASSASMQPASLDAAGALCRPSDHGALRARLQGVIDAELDWAAPVQPQCLGGARPGGGGLRLVYKGNAGTDALLVIVGIAIAPQVRTERHLPASITIVREGSGQFFATQGDDKCALDEVVQEPVDASAGRYRLSGRGYCTQPARALGGAQGSVLVSRFDVEAIVEHLQDP